MLVTRQLLRFGRITNFNIRRPFVFCLLFLALFLCRAECSYSLEKGYSKQRLAVLNFDTRNLDEGTAQAVTEYTQSCFENTNLYVVVERNKIEQVLHEQAFQLSGAVDNTTIGSLGQILGASRLVFGSINKMGGNVVISARIVNSETGEIVISGTETGEETRINYNVQRLVRSLVREDRSKYQAYLRALTYDNSLRIKTDFSPFIGAIAMMQNDEKNFDISYRRKGFPLLMMDTLHTEFEIGSYVTSGDGVLANGNQIHNEIKDYACSLNVQYYLPVSFFENIYLKAGGGISFRSLKQKARVAGQGESDSTLLNPIGKIGLGIDIFRANAISVQVEGIYNHFSIKSSDPQEPNRLTLNIGAAYNW